MKLEGEFGDRMRAVVRGIAPEGQPQAEALIESLAQAGGNSEEALTAMARDPGLGSALRSDATWLIARMQSEQAGAVLRELLSDPSEQVREEAALDLGLLAGGDMEDDTDRTEAVQRLLNMVDRDPTKSVRLAALHALGMIGSSISTPGLIRVLEDPSEDAEVRADAAEASAHVGDERIVDALIDSLSDSSPLVRYSAAYALGEQGDPKAVPSLTELASHDDAETKWGSVASSARRALESIANRN